MYELEHYDVDTEIGYKVVRENKGIITTLWKLIPLSQHRWKTAPINSTQTIKDGAWYDVGFHIFLDKNAYHSDPYLERTRKRTNISLWEVKFRNLMITGHLSKYKCVAVKDVKLIERVTYLIDFGVV